VRLALGISTDKACRASTAYGASKLLLESIWRNQAESDTRFVCVRYGNVVASNGSVIPIWREQAQAGKFLSITDNRMTRFWMSPADAVKLITVAADGRSGDVWIPKMSGLPIVRMAEIICPGAKIAETGLRSSEKLHEDLVASDEPATETIEHFILRKIGTLGHHYTSSDCPALTAAAFTAMLRDAEDLEARK
jgi:FlaA1/EpsC-like NDP-sugar epimerase